MAGKREKPEDIVMKLRQVEVLQGQGMSVAEAVRQVGITQQTYYRWRRQYGGMSRDQLKRLKELEKDNARLRRAVSDLSLDNMILTESGYTNKEDVIANAYDQGGVLFINFDFGGLARIDNMTKALLDPGDILL
jgi:transposase-like protein